MGRMPRKSKRQQHSDRVWVQRKRLEVSTEACSSTRFQEANEQVMLSENRPEELNEDERDVPLDINDADRDCDNTLNPRTEESDGEETIDVSFSERYVDESPSDDDFVPIADAPDMMEYSKDWVSSLQRSDQQSVSILLHSLLVDKLEIPKTKAADMIGQVIGVSDRTVRDWRSLFVENDGCFLDMLQGKYVRDDVL